MTIPARGSQDVPDSLVFKTDMGRTVYGGGGVMPDVVVRAGEIAEVSRTCCKRSS